MARADVERALARWPEVAEITALLTARLPPRTPGFHRIDLPEVAATLELAYGEAAEALALWQGRADAWFLDGFAPAANPQMWRDEVLSLIVQRSAPGARAATFTVAGEVRRGLAAQGFDVLDLGTDSTASVALIGSRCSGAHAHSSWPASPVVASVARRVR